MLCNWKPGDIITAHHLNQMTCAINANTSGLNQLGNIVSDKGSSSFSGSGGIDMGAFTGTGLESCATCLNRGYFRSGWEYTEAGDTKKGLYVNKSGVENALSGSYPETVCSVCLEGQNSGLGIMDIMIKTTTDCYGKVLSQCIFTQPTASNSGGCQNSSNVLWQGPASNSSCGSSAGTYSFTRRIGRVTDDTTHPISSCSSTYYNKVLKTNDLVMPILPARAEKEEDGPCLQTFSVLGDYKDNSVLIKNIRNGGGLQITKNQTNLNVRSGVEFYAGKSCTNCCGQQSSTFDATTHVVPQCFDITVACIPIKEMHYEWCSTTSSWVPKNSGDSTACSIPEAETKGNIQIKAKSLNGNSWQIGWTSSGEIEIPVKDFSPTEAVEYEAGRGISISEQEVPSTDPNSTETTKKNVICNTMEICAGCNISVEQTDAEKPAYKISACKMKLEAGDGIKVECITGGYKISTCESQAICITNGAGISVTKTNNTFTITNTAMHDAIEVVEGDGIKVTQTGNKYKVSLAAPCCSCSPGGYKCYIFDPAWFTVTGDNVTLNQAKIDEVASTIAVNTTVNASVTNVLLDTVSGHFGTGEIVGSVDGLDNGLNADGSIQRV